MQERMYVPQLHPQQGQRSRLLRTLPRISHPTRLFRQRRKRRYEETAENFAGRNLSAELRVQGAELR